MAGATHVNAKKRSTLATFGVLLAILLLGMGLRLYQLDTDSFWLDEVKTATTSRLDFVSMLDFQVQKSVHPPLLYVLNHVFMTILGMSDFVLRVPCALLGAASVALAYKLGELLWTRKEGLIGAFLVAVNPYLVQYSQEARHYALMVFLLLFSLIFVLIAVRRGGIAAWLGFAVSTSLAIYTHYFSFLALPALVAVALWMIWKRGPLPVGEGASPPSHPRRQTLALLVSLALAGASFLPWLPAMREQLLQPDLRLGGFGSLGESARILSPGFFCDLLADYTGWGGIPLLLLLVLFMIGLWLCRREYLLFFGLLVVTPFAFVALAQTSHFFSVRYTIYILPPCLLLIGRGTSALADWLERPLGGGIGQLHTSPVLLSCFAILLGLLNVVPLRDYYRYEKEDWRGSVAYLAANLAPGDGIIADSTVYGPGKDADRPAECLTYYMGAYGITSNSPFRVDDTLWWRLTEWAQWNGRLWAVLWHPWEHPKDSADGAVELPHVSILRLQEPSGDALSDTERLLGLLLDLIAESDARFNVHVALANIHLRTGRLVDAGSELDLASELVPDSPKASASLEKGLARFGRLSQALSAMRNPLWRNFGNELALLGYTLEPDKARPGDTLQLTVWWYALQEMDRDYTAFVHMVDPNDSIGSQQDKLLRRAKRGTSQWSTGAIAMEKYEISLPPDAPPGLFAINLGVYYWETAERLPARDESGERLASDVVQVCQIEVEG